MLRSFMVSVVVLACATTAQAGVMGRSLLQLTDIVINKIDGVGGPVIGPVTGRFNSAGSSDIRITGSTTIAINEAQLLGQPFDDTFTSLTVNPGGFGLIGPANPAYAYSGSNVPGAAGVVFDPPNAPATGPLAADYTRSDSVFGDSFVQIAAGDTNPNPGPGQPDFDTLGTGAFASTFADFNVESPGLTGNALSNVTNTTSVTFTADATFRARFDFNAIVDLYLNDTGLPAGYFTTAISSFSISLTSSGASPGFSLGSADAPLNQTITQNGVGTNSYSISDDFQSDEFNITAGSFYTLTVNQTSTVLVAQASQVPEPSSLAIFGVMGVAGLAVGRRKLKKS